MSSYLHSPIDSLQTLPVIIWDYITLIHTPVAFSSENTAVLLSVLNIEWSFVRMSTKIWRNRVCWAFFRQHMNYSPFLDQNHDHGAFSKTIFVFHKCGGKTHSTCHSEWMMTVHWLLCLERLMMLQEQIF